jgi:hypothetical protein
MFWFQGLEQGAKSLSPTAAAASGAAGCSSQASSSGCNETDAETTTQAAQSHAEVSILLRSANLMFKWTDFHFPSY